jgi:proteasome accessory factor C
MYNQNRILRVLQLIAILQKEPAKSIRYLSSYLHTTERTTYRYLDLIKELGLDLCKNEQNKYFIINVANGIGFTQQEAILLTELLKSSAKHHKLKDSILKKIYVNYEIAISANQILKAHLGKLIETLSKAIHSNKQVILKKYHSANTQTIKDRLVEPIKFTDNYTALAAYEIESGENKYFNIERITDVKITNKNVEFKKQHAYNAPDAFGFGSTTKDYKVELRLNLRAYVILKEEYPLAIPYLKPERKSKNTYLLNITVNDFKPITRFVIGLIDDVEVLGSLEFKTHLKSITEKLLNNKIKTITMKPSLKKGKHK